MYSRNMFTPPTALRPKFPLVRMNYEDLMVNNCMFKALREQHEILQKLLSKPDIFEKVLEHPSRKLLVRLRDVEYFEFTTPYMRSTMPNYQKISVLSDGDKTIIEFTVDL